MVNRILGNSEIVIPRVEDKLWPEDNLIPPQSKLFRVQITPLKHPGFAISLRKISEDR